MMLGKGNAFYGVSPTMVAVIKVFSLVVMVHNVATASMY